MEGRYETKPREKEGNLTTSNGRSGRVKLGRKNQNEGNKLMEHWGSASNTQEAI